MELGYSRGLDVEQCLEFGIQEFICLPLHENGLRAILSGAKLHDGECMCCVDDDALDSGG